MATLLTMSMAQGVAYLIKSGMLIVIRNDDLKALLAGKAWGINAQVLTFIMVTVVFTLIMRFSVFGRQLYAIGGNAEAARLSGLPVTRNLVAAYAISGLLAGLAGLLAAQLGQAGSLMARGAELDSIAAAVVGGASLFGGVGTPLAAVVGGLLIATISNIFDLRGVAAEPQLIMKGLLILLTCI